jgi:hypothetical protein
MTYTDVCQYVTVLVETGQQKPTLYAETFPLFCSCLAQYLSDTNTFRLKVVEKSFIPNNLLA